MKYCGETIAKKLRYEKEAKYNQHIQFAGRLIEWDGLNNI